MTTKYHDHLAKFGYSKYIIAPFLVRVSSISSSLGPAVGISAPVYVSPKCETQAQYKLTWYAAEAYQNKTEVRLGENIVKSSQIINRNRSPSPENTLRKLPNPASAPLGGPSRE